MTNILDRLLYGYFYNRFGDARLSVLLTVMLIIGTLGLLAALAAFFAAGVMDGIFERHLCIKISCLNNASEAYKYVFSIMSATIGLLVAVATIGGIFVALLSYLHATSATAFGNHISHLTVFQSYLISEINKRPRIMPSSVDIFYWYHLIFPDARSGRLVVSGRYEDLILELGGQIFKSNEQATRAKGGSFRYVDHQNRIISALSKIGLKVDRQPRIEFFEIEDEVFSLIRAVNSAFCMGSEKCEVPQRVYR